MAIYKFEKAVVWLDGTSLAGHVSEIELPEINWESVDHESLGFLGTPQHATKVEAMECTITWADYSPELAAAAADPYTRRQLQIRAVFGKYEAGSKVADVLGRFTIAGRFMSNSLGSFSATEYERESMMAVDYVKEEHDGVSMFEFSVEPPILRANGGENVFAAIRDLLGV